MWLNVMNASLRERTVLPLRWPPSPQEAIARPDCFRKSSPCLQHLGGKDDCLASSEALDEAVYLDPFQPGFRLGYWIEMALVALVDMWCILDGGCLEECLFGGENHSSHSICHKLLRFFGRSN